MPAPAVTVVIPTRDRLPLLRRAARSVLADPGTLELVIVDAGHDPLTAAWMTRTAAELPRLRGLRRPGATAGAARQAGLEAARGTRVLFLDDDVVPGPALVTGHARRAAMWPGAAVVVGPTPPAAPRGRSSAAERVYAAEYARRTAGYADGDAVLRHLWGGNVSLPRELALAVGVAPPAPLGYHEDRDFGLRLLAAGARGIWAPELAAAHHHARRNDEGARDARRRAAAAVALAALHPHTGTPPAPGRDLPAPARRMLGACSGPRAHRAAAAALAHTTSAAARLRARAAEETAYKLWRRLEEQQGTQEAQRG